MTIVRLPKDIRQQLPGGDLEPVMREAHKGIEPQPVAVRHLAPGRIIWRPGRSAMASGEEMNSPQALCDGGPSCRPATVYFANPS